MTTNKSNDTVITTLKDLEHRLQRLAFYLSGDAAAALDHVATTAVQKAASRESNKSAHARIKDLENRLAELSLHSKSCRYLIQMCRSSPLAQTTELPMATDGYSDG